jgi:hypothetical protein
MMTSDLMLNLARDRQRDLLADAARTRLVASGRRTRRAKKRATGPGPMRISRAEWPA